MPLVLAPGTYRAGGLKLPSGANIVGVRGETKLVTANAQTIFSARRADNVSLTGLVLDGDGLTLPERRGLLHMFAAHGFRVTDCAIMRAGGNGIHVEQSDGAVTHTTISDSANIALFSLDGAGLIDQFGDGPGGGCTRAVF